jgi:hypothetical protein
MNAEVSIFGVFTPSLLLCAPVAYLLAAGIKQMLGAVGFYTPFTRQPENPWAI